MRNAFPLLLLTCLLFSLVGSICPLVFADPKAEALDFLQALQQGDVIKVVKNFGSNACNCPAKGGWVSYVIYPSGQEQNLAFLLGHPFDIDAAPHAIPVNNHREALTPWQHPQDYLVDVPLSFDAKKYMPLFLPLKLAYGYNMKKAEFDRFLRHPEEGAWKGLTLRLRPSLNKGAINPPAVQVPPGMVSDFEALSKSQAGSKENDNRVNEDEDLKKILGGEATDYLTPKDPGSVISEDGTVLPIDQVTASLPRLKSATLELHVVRRSQLQNWTIYHFGLMYPVLVSADGRDIDLLHAGDKQPLTKTKLQR